jgi:hypothetical protein
MANQIVNAAPMVVEYGTQDLSTRQPPRVPEAIPQHLPKFYLFTQKGPKAPQLCSGAERDRLFGSASFDYRGKFSNHQTVFANLANAQGNACMIQRLFPTDMGPKSNIIAWLDVLPTTVDLYRRNSDGSIYLDALNQPEVIGTTTGHKVKWVFTNRTTVADQTTQFGLATISAGDQIDVTAGVQSQRYPMFELEVSSEGEWGNNSGLRLWAPTVKTVSAMPNKMMVAEKAYPYYISVVERADAQSSAAVVPTLFGEQRLMVTLKENVIDPLTDRSMNLNEVFLNSYQNLTDARYPKLFGNFGKLHIYQANLELLLGQFHAAEVAHIDGFSDFTANTADKHLFNIVSGVSSQNVKYHSFTFIDDTSSTRLSEVTNVYAKGGSDGTMNNTVHAALTSAEALRYLNPNDELMDLAYHVESIVYDSGFPLQTKKDLCSIMAVRKDTFVAVGTHTAGERALTQSEEQSVAIALRTHMQMYPESDYFGTPVSRGMIMGCSGVLRNSQYTDRLPMTGEILIKSAKYMGAADGRWKNGFHFDGAPGSVIDNFTDINITWVSASVRNRFWDVGLNWVLTYDRSSYFFPALKTVYDNDTSVLNSYFTAMACAQLNKVANSVWRQFSGVSHLTNTQLASRVNDAVTARVQGKFDGRFVIQPDALFTDMDEVRGFSWTLPIKLYAPSMKTVMTTYVQAYRISDLPAA